MDWRQIVLEVMAAVSLAFIIGAFVFVTVKSRSISKSRRFPVFFFGLSMLGYFLLTLEIALYTVNHDLSDNRYLWIFYVVGMPLCFLPVMMLSWRLKIIYAGYYDLVDRRRVPLTHVRIELGDKWLTIRLLIFLVPCLAFYPFLVLFPGYADIAYIVWQLLYMLLYLTIVVALMRQRKLLRQHHQDQTLILMLVWVAQFCYIAYANLAWYVFHFWNHRFLSDLIQLLVLDIQMIIICCLWYANYRVVRDREQMEKEKGLKAQKSADMFLDEPLSGKGNEQQTASMLLEH